MSVQRKIDLKSRQQQFDFFMAFGDPTFGVTVQIDVTSKYKRWKSAKILNAGLIHSVSTAINQIPQFKQRITDDLQVIEWDVIHPGFTILKEDETFAFCFVEFKKDLAEFAPHCRSLVEKAKTRAAMFDPAQADTDVFYLSIVPLLHFTAISHPIKNPPDSVPRMAIGQCVEQPDGRVLMPLNVQVHHALIDALHISRFFEAVQAYFHDSIY